MKTVILAVNSKYVHTLLAPRYLKANAHGDISIYETNINFRRFDVLKDLVTSNPDVIAVSVYIFNTDFVKAILKDIRKILPSVKIISGGYEAVFDEEYMRLCDCVIRGEGDFAFGKVLSDLEKGIPVGKIVEAGYVKDLNSLASPYDDEYCRLGEEKILYMETSRGCPFHCSYCMSARGEGVRTFSADRVFEDLERVMRYDVKQIKFVDRTFNFDTARAAKIIRHIVDMYGHRKTNFHFEMAPELFDDELFDALCGAKKGLIRLEIGVQTYNPDTLKKISRKADFSKIESNLKRLITQSNVTVHVDLIAGLPGEDKRSFVNGFNRLMSLKPHCLQMGFLKVLKGSKLAYDNREIVYSDEAPYEILHSPALSFWDIAELKEAEEMLELYYNSGRFIRSVAMILDRVSPYEVFSGLYRTMKKKNSDRMSLSARQQCDIIYSYGREIFSSDSDTDALFSAVNEDFAADGNVRVWRKNKNFTD